MQNATTYFENYLLSDRTSPVVLVLDDVDQVFEHSDIRDDFCKLLVGWHRLGASGRSNRRSKSWSLLRVIVSHSTEVYVDWDIHHSPFLGVGTVAQLSDFEPPQILQMMDFFGVTLSDADLNELMNLIGGHPLLLVEAFKDLRDTGRSVEQLLSGATTDAGPFGNDLRRKFDPLKHSPDLWEGFRQVLEADEPVVLSTSVRYRLERMGLVRFVQTETEQNACVNRYELYRRYFLNQCDGV